MKIFWQQGYFKTSIDELVKASGLNRASIYKEFGGKDDFFIAMLERYRQQVTSEKFKPLMEPAKGLEAIVAFFEQFLVLSGDRELKDGCFFINTAADLPLHNELVGRSVKRFMADLKSLFQDALAHAKNQQQVSEALNIEQCSAFLVTNVFGLISMGRATGDTNLIEAHLKMMWQFLQAL